MPDYPLVFVHGWGFDSSFWDDLVQHFPEKALHRIDLGFFGDADAGQDCPEGIYITHSLGTMWALHHAQDKIRGLVAINGFCTFRPFASKRVLEAMKTRLRQDLEVQMTEFMATCGLRKKHDIALFNVDRLEEGLDWLGTWDESKTLQGLDMPVLSLISADDRILPLEGMRKMWQNSSVCVKGDGGHVLPQSETAWCLSAIKDFLDDWKLEIKRSAEL